MESLDEIKYLIEEGQLVEAKARIKMLDSTISQVPELYSLKAVISIIEGSLTDAEGFIFEGLSQDPQNADLLFNMAYIFNVRNEYEKARQFYKLALKYTESYDSKVSIFEALESLQPKIDNEQTKQPLVSVVVLAYNKLDYTRLCVESILKFTSHIDYELITVDNGSTDNETREFFHSLPNARVVFLNENVGPTRGFNAGIKVARGKYTACVCNDFIFTPRWLDNLLICIESDQSIGFVSPGANMISNMQHIAGKYSSISEMLQFANDYNYSDPNKWEERVRLLPCVLMVRTKLLQELGGYDERFYFGEFADDDIAFRIRRKGYKLIFCKDTFTFHYGSVTTIHDQRENNSLQKSRQIFIDKYNLDVWTDANFNSNMVDNLSKLIRVNNVELLGINTKCGGNPLQLKNRLRQKDIDQVRITNFCIEEKYLDDVRTVSDEVMLGQLSDCYTRLNSRKYDVLIFEHNLGIFVKMPKLIDEMLGLLQKDGHFALLLKIEDETEIDSISHIWAPKYGLRLTYELFSNDFGDFIMIIGEKGI